MFTPTRILSVVFLFLFAGVFSQENKKQDKLHASFSERVDEREQLVIKGIENYPHNPVRDPLVLEAMRRVPRHAFVPKAYQREAYRNSPLAIGNNQTISQPYIVASMTELLQLKPEHRVLEIGTGSGYQAAILGELCQEVFSIEIIPALGLKAEKLLNELGYDHVHVKIGDGYEGWPSHAPFDRIIVTCAPEEIPQPLIDQLIPGGRFVIPVGPQMNIQYLVIVTKDLRGRVRIKNQYPVRFVPMTGKASEIN